MTNLDATKLYDENSYETYRWLYSRLQDKASSNRFCEGWMKRRDAY